MTTVRVILTQYLKDLGFDGLAGDECGCDKTDLFPCDSCPDKCVPGYRWECEGPCLVGESEEGCESYEYMGGCYRATRQGEGG